MGGDDITLGCQYTYCSRLDLQLQNNAEGKKTLYTLSSLSLNLRLAMIFGSFGLPCLEVVLDKKKREKAV